MSGDPPRFGADPEAAVHCVQLETLTILFHRPSGITHVLAPPAPQILEMLREWEGSLAELGARLAERFELAGGEDELASRLEELKAAGLVYSGA